MAFARIRDDRRILRFYGEPVAAVVEELSGRHGVSPDMARILVRGAHFKRQAMELVRERGFETLDDLLVAFDALSSRHKGTAA
jgi:hypothetical protein